MAIDESAETAALLRMPRRALRILCKRHRISHVQLNYRNYLFSRRDIAEFLERHYFHAKEVVYE